MSETAVGKITATYSGQSCPGCQQRRSAEQDVRKEVKRAALTKVEAMGKRSRSRLATNAEFTLGIIEVAF